MVYIMLLFFLVDFSISLVRVVCLGLIVQQRTHSSCVGEVYDVKFVLGLGKSCADVIYLICGHWMYFRLLRVAGESCGSICAFCALILVAQRLFLGDYVGAFLFVGDFI